jgi:hypothetical protein
LEDIQHWKLLRIVKSAGAIAVVLFLESGIWNLEFGTPEPKNGNLSA